MVYLLFYKNSKFMVIKSDFFKSSRFLFLKNENEFEIFRIPPPRYLKMLCLLFYGYTIIRSILRIY